MADIWESQNGLATNNAGDALLDPDNDKMRNRDEYIAGTNPTNELSLLKLFFPTPTALNFTAQSNISYSVLWQTNPVLPVWNTLTNVSALPSVRTIEMDATTEPLAPQKYFRVVTPIVE
jgi:hypothetical protein